MKRSNERIGKNTEVGRKSIHLKGRKSVFPALFIILSLTACEKAWHGSDGRPGRAFLSLTWQASEPTYLDAGTGAVPPVFHWGTYYRINPGRYFIYYEGRVNSGMGWAWYAWEVEYRISVIPGEPGGWHYHGADGPDNYFTIECNPFGPYIYNGYKNTGEVPEGEYPVVDDEKITVTKKGEGYELEIEYRKVEPRFLKDSEQVSDTGN